MLRSVTTLLAAAAMLLPCAAAGQQASDGYAFKKGEWQRAEFRLRLVAYGTPDEVRQAARAAHVQETSLKKTSAFSQMPLRETGLCTVHVLASEVAKSYLPQSGVEAVTRARLTVHRQDSAMAAGAQAAGQDGALAVRRGAWAAVDGDGVLHLHLSDPRYQFHRSVLTHELMHCAFGRWHP